MPKKPQRAEQLTFAEVPAPGPKPRRISRDEVLSKDPNPSTGAAVYAWAHLETVDHRIPGHKLPDRPTPPLFVACPYCEKLIRAFTRPDVVKAYVNHEAAHRTEEGQPKLIEAPGVTAKLKPYCDDPARDEDGLLA